MLNIQKGVLNWPLIRYGFAVCMVAAGFLLRQVLTAYGGSHLPTYTTFYPPVMVVAMVAGFWPGIVTTMMVVLVIDYWILPPQGFGIESFTDAVGLVFFFGYGCVHELGSRILSSCTPASSGGSFGVAKSERCIATSILKTSLSS